MPGKSTLYKLVYRRWKNIPAQPVPGYALMVPVPGDLPVFLSIAMETVRRQAATHRIETLVIPDRASNEFRTNYQRLAQDWNGPIRLVEFPPFSQRLARRMNSPFLNYWFQVMYGIEASNASHALLHDADLFILDPQFLDRHYASAIEHQLLIHGVSEVWDKWYSQHHITHMVATWEMLFDMQWARSFKPWQHRGHNARIAGEFHATDVLLLAQTMTDPARVGRNDCQHLFVHFNHVIGTYRKFQNHPEPYEDEHFRMLLIRLLTDAYQAPETPGELPSIEGLAAGIRDPKARVTYRMDLTAAHYREFRMKMSRLLASKAMTQERSAGIATALVPFDHAFARDDALLV